MRMWTVWCLVLYFFGASEASAETPCLFCCGENAVCFLTVLLLLCLTGAKITQNSSLVLKEDENATLGCSQNDNHNYMYWYLQQPGKGLQLIYYSYGANQEYKGDIHTGYEAKRLSQEYFRLDIMSVKKNHSAIYFCASSLDTTLQSHLLSVRKLLSSTFPQKGVALSTPRIMVRRSRCYSQNIGCWGAGPREVEQVPFH